MTCHPTVGDIVQPFLAATPTTPAPSLSASEQLTATAAVVTRTDPGVKVQATADNGQQHRRS